MSGPHRNILHGIGNTGMVALRNVVPENGARVLLKLENENPTGSMKDRMALAMVEAAEADGRLRAGGSVVEYTGGSTGVSLSLVCAVKGYPLHIVTSDAFAREKLDHMEILGARLEVIPSDGGGMTEKLTRDMVEAAGVLARKPGSFWTDQLNNPDPFVAYHRMGEEIWSQTDGRIDGFVQSVGTAGSVRGIGEALRRRNESIRIVAVEPSESAVLSGGATGAHKIDGVGAGFVVPLWRDDVADRIEQVSTEDAVAMAMRLAREEGLLAGTSTGANVIAALRLAEQLGPDATIVTIMCDTGLKYLSTALFQAHTSSSVLLRDVQEGDLPILFEHQADPVANRMAAFTPRNRDAFMAHWETKILGDRTVVKKAILFDGQLAGFVVCFERSGKREIGYWIGREFWGKGLATRALSRFLRDVSERPLYSMVAKHNVASIRVLEKCGFVLAGQGRGSADGRGPEVDELLLRLDRTTDG